MSKKSTTKSELSEPMNPILVTGRGINALFARAATTGIFLAVVGFAGSVVNGYFQPDTESKNKNPLDSIADYFRQTSYEQLLITLLIIIAIAVVVLMVSAVIHGLQSYAALQLSKGKRVGLNESINEVLSHFGSYLIFYFWMNLKIALWSLLLIVPGIIAYYRYTFAGQFFFEDDKNRLNKPIAESNRLAKGGLMTIFASQFLFNLITLFWLDRIVNVASNAELYKRYTELESKKQLKPGVHWLSWLTLALPFILILMLILFTAAIAVILTALK